MSPEDGLESLREEVVRLRAELEVERARRATAEALGKQADGGTDGDVADTVEELRAAQRELVASAERTRLVREVMRSLRSVADSGAVRELAAQEIGTRLGVDRCIVVTLEPEFTGVRWAADGAPPALSGSPYDDPALVQRQLHDLAAAGSAVIDDSEVPNERWPDVTRQARGLGVRAVVIAPMMAGSHLVGALVVASVTPRAWDRHTIGVCEEAAMDLGHLLVHLTSQEQEARLRHLVDLDRTKDAFVSNVSHELRTPLASITGYLELLQEGELGKLPDPVDRALEVVSRNAFRLRSLVEDLLTFSAHAAGETYLDQVSVDMGKLVDECCQTLLPWARSRAVQLDESPVPDLPRVWGDGPQLRRAVHRVISNAVKFTPAGGRVEVSVEHGGGELTVVVADTGPGISPEECDQVFTPFFRSSRSVRDEVPGTGLGLPLVKAVVDLHNGSVTLDSEEGSGTTVRITLPVGPPAAGREA